MSYRTNIYASDCDCCGGQVAPREGRLIDRNMAGGWIVRHHDCAERQTTRTRATLAPVVPHRDGLFNVWALSANGRWYKRNSYARPFGSADAFAAHVRYQPGWQKVAVLRQGLFPWVETPVRYAAYSRA